MKAEQFVTIDLEAIRSAAISIRKTTGVDVIGVLKSDAYGCRQKIVAEALEDLVSGWYVLHTSEAIAWGLWEMTKKPILVGAPLSDETADELKQMRIRPAVWNLEMLRRLERADPVLAIDTGMQRFACPASELESMMSAHPFDEAFTHAARPEQAQMLRRLVGSRIPRLHAAGSALLDDPTCRFNAVRPGIALYRNAVTIKTWLAETRDGVGPAGYSQFECSRHGVILQGFSSGLRPGPCFVNGRDQCIIEVGMQTSYVSLDRNDHVGDEVELLGKNVSLEAIANAWKCTEHEVLISMNRMVNC